MSRGGMLTEDEWRVAQDVGQVRYDRVMSKGFEDPSGRAAKRSPERDWNGAAAEAYVAKLLGQPWDRGIEGKRPDVGPYFVRSTDSPNGQLLVHATHPERPACKSPDHPGVYILAIGKRRAWVTAGWAFFPDILANAQWAPFHRKTSPCYWVKQRYLFAMRELPNPATAALYLNDEDYAFVKGLR